ncbi:EF-hand and coiled-coil domain-containing protein 1 isoform X1 [Phascolarctos cinereus]|uniref:EF-hand and coiled-coil domain-containing protein 1 isoform X4 n=1 Tax=Phascolarctos cinereus TaxID=38626 RepID=A0A6P5JY13_PHACI|nr:EF-hand and coiled-coil domain-containing protein 1 isoform X4 [Phascolarctos cinereus]
MEPGPVDAWDPYRRPARRTQWLVSALAHHYRLDRGVENEIVVLATGLDQYLQEVFHHLDCKGDGRLPGEDFRVLCRVLGLRPGAGLGAEGGCSEEEEDEEERAALWDDLAPELTFRQFHARLCGYFSTRAGAREGPEGSRLPVGPESEHIETQIRLRSPLRRRRERPGASAVPAASGRTRSSPPATAVSCTGSAGCSRECYEEVVALEQAEDRVAKLEEENASLRELVEDMRAALQSSDARCLALQVGLWKSHASHKQDGNCFPGPRMLSGHGTPQPTKDLQSMLKEVELIRSSRDGQIEEAIQVNQELAKELRQCQEALAASEDCNRHLKKEQAEMRKKVEEARQAVLSGLGKVRELEAQATQVLHLQMCVQQLELELQYYRSEIRKLPSPLNDQKMPREDGESETGRASCPGQPDGISPPEGAAAAEDGMSCRYADEGGEQLFRSVEGQAASDEEEEKWPGEQQTQVAEVKRLLARISSCGSGCDDKTAKKLMSYFGHFGSDEHTSALGELGEQIVTLTEQLGNMGQDVKVLDTGDQEGQLFGTGMRRHLEKKVKEPLLLSEIQQKAEESELLKMELQMLETERVRLSLVEEKLMDVLHLLQRLRDLNISKRVLGKMLLNTLESCQDPQHEKAHTFEVLDALYRTLASCELLQKQPLEQAQAPQALANQLIISC